MVVDKCPRDHEAMKYLVAVKLKCKNAWMLLTLPSSFWFKSSSYPDVKFSWEEPFWDPDRVEHSAGDVEATHQDEPAEGTLLHRLLPAVGDTEVCGWRYAAQPEKNEYSCKESSFMLPRSIPNIWSHAPGTLA